MCVKQRFCRWFSNVHGVLGMYTVSLTNPEKPARQLAFFILMDLLCYVTLHYVKMLKAPQQKHSTSWQPLMWVILRGNYLFSWSFEGGSLHGSVAGFDMISCHVQRYLSRWWNTWTLEHRGLWIKQSIGINWTLQDYVASSSFNSIQAFNSNMDPIEFKVMKVTDLTVQVTRFVLELKQRQTCTQCGFLSTGINTWGFLLWVRMDYLSTRWCHYSSNASLLALFSAAIGGTELASWKYRFDGE